MKISSRFFERNPDLVQLADSLVNILEANTLCTIATVDHDGSPCACILYFAADENLNLYVLTSPTTQQARNLEGNSSVALTIYDSDQPWGQPHCGIQLTGTCRELHGDELEAGFKVYSTRFPQVLELVHSATEAMRELELRPYVTVPSFVRLIDEPRYGSDTRFTLQLT